MVPSLCALTFDAFSTAGRAAFVAARGEPKGSGVAAGLYRRFFQNGVWNPAAEGLPEAAVQIWNQAVDPTPPLVLETLQDDEAGGSSARKALFRLPDGPTIETVLVPMFGGEAGRGTLCLSSQAGCAMACAFCETGRTGLLRNLTPGEIVGQVMAARFQLGWDFSSLVFMGMGEPLHNFDAVLGALEVLTDPRGLAFAQEKITVCTVGLADEIDRLGRRGFKRMGLSLSLNAGSQSLRERLMPAGVTNPLDRLKTSLQAYPQRRNFVLALNYCLMPGVNDTEDDARGVADFAAGLGRTTVNVIPYNPGTRPVAPAPTETEVEAFLSRLKSLGLDARVRGTKGRSIMAACGQLGGRRDLIVDFSTD